MTNKPSGANIMWQRRVHAERATRPAARCRPVWGDAAVALVDRDIRDFLRGKSDGADLLHRLYDHVLDEPVPERLQSLLRR